MSMYTRSRKVLYDETIWYKIGIKKYKSCKKFETYAMNLRKMQ